MKPTFLFAVSGLLLLWALACLRTVTHRQTALGINGNARSPRATGMMPEVVSVADRPRLVLDEIVVRAPHPNRLADAAAPVSVIN